MLPYLFLFLPVIALSVASGIYVYPGLTIYHRRVLDGLGNDGQEVLEGRLSRLANLNLTTSCALALTVLLERLTQESYVSASTGVAPFLVLAPTAIAVITTLWLVGSDKHARWYDGIIVLDKKIWAGVTFGFLSIAYTFALVLVTSRLFRPIPPCVMAAALLIMAYGSRSLGNLARVRTPWHFPAALAATTLIGIITL